MCIPNVIRSRQKGDEQGWMFWSGQGLSALMQANGNGQKDMIRSETELLRVLTSLKCSETDNKASDNVVSLRLYLFGNARMKRHTVMNRNAYFYSV